MSEPDQGHTDKAPLPYGYGTASGMCGVHKLRVRHTALGTTSTYGGRPPQADARRMLSCSHGVRKSMVHPPGSPRMGHMVRHGTAEHMCGGHTPNFFRIHSRRIHGRPFLEAIESTGRAYVAPCHRSTPLRLWQHRAGTVLDGIYSLDSHAAGIHVCIDHRRNAALHEMVDADSIRGGTSTCMCAAHHASRLGNRGIASALACLAHWPLGAKHFVP